jgi:hypothetical protein
VTRDSVSVMNDQEQRDLAKQLADSSEVFGFNTALEIVKRRPADAEKLLRMREKTAMRKEEMERARERRKRALIEDYG